MASTMSDEIAAYVRKTFKEASLNADGTSRVSEDEIKLALAAAVKKASADGKLNLTGLKTGTVGTVVPLSFPVTNDEGKTFTIKGSISFRVPETVDRTKPEPEESEVSTSTAVAVVPA